MKHIGLLLLGAALLVLAVAAFTGCKKKESSVSYTCVCFYSWGFGSDTMVDNSIVSSSRKYAEDSCSRMFVQYSSYGIGSGCKLK